MTSKPPPPTRRATRFAAGVPAVLRWAGREFPCEAENLSRSGALLTGDLPLQAGPDVALSLASGAGDLRVSLGARVQRASVEEGGQVQLGVEFGEVGSGERETLESLVSRVVEGLLPASLASLPRGAPPQQVRSALEQVPVAHRASLALRGVAREREILLQDTDPQVLDGLARNPNLTPPEARTLLRARQLLPRTLEMLGRESRFAAVEELKILIACHPNTPFSAAERLINSLTPDGKKRALRQPGLNPELRFKLARQSRRKVVR